MVGPACSCMIWAAEWSMGRLACSSPAIRWRVPLGKLGGASQHRRRWRNDASLPRLTMISPVMGQWKASNTAREPGDELISLAPSRAVGCSGSVSTCEPVHKTSLNPFLKATWTSRGSGAPTFRAPHPRAPFHPRPAIAHLSIRLKCPRASRTSNRHFPQLQLLAHRILNTQACVFPGRGGNRTPD
jgi:hypothetical protein